MSDHINPDHYKASCSLECIDIMRTMFGDEETAFFCLCNSFKYLWRYKNKNGEEDLKKADWYLTYVDKICFQRVEEDWNWVNVVREKSKRLRRLLLNHVITRKD